MQDATINTLQRKLDDMWERQAIEKENVKLMSKFETEQGARQRISELTDKYMTSESEVKHLNAVRDVLTQ